MKFSFSRESFQILLVVMGFGWGVYTFVWSEYIFSRLQPPRLELDSGITEVGNDGSDLASLAFKLSNPGVRSVYAYNARWFLYDLGRQNPGSELDFASRVRGVVRDAGPHVELSSRLVRRRLIAAGSLFDSSVFPAGMSHDISFLITLPSQASELNLVVFLPHGFHASTPRGDFRLSYADDSAKRWVPILCPFSALSDFSVNSCIFQDDDRFARISRESGIDVLGVNVDFPLGGRSSTIRIRS